MRFRKVLLRFSPQMTWQFSIRGAKLIRSPCIHYSVKCTVDRTHTLVLAQTFSYYFYVHLDALEIFFRIFKKKKILSMVWNRIVYVINLLK